MLLTYDRSDDVLQFVNSHDAASVSQIGAACPDHLVHTKRVPLFIDWNPETKDIKNLIETIKDGIEKFKEEYKAYFDRNKNEGDNMVEPAPRVILIPGVGMVNTGKDVANSHVSGALYHRAISVMKGTTTLGNFVSLSENESYNVEYWPLELYKLSLAPAEAEFSRKVAFVTGGAGGIGSETCRQFVSQGAHVVVADLNLEGAQKIAAEINTNYGPNRAVALKMDVTKKKKFMQLLLKLP